MVLNSFCMPLAFPPRFASMGNLNLASAFSVTFQDRLVSLVINVEMEELFEKNGLHLNGAVTKNVAVHLFASEVGRQITYQPKQQEK